MLNTTLRQCWRQQSRLIARSTRPRSYPRHRSITKRYASYQNFPQAGGPGGPFSRFGSSNQGKGSNSNSNGGPRPYSNNRIIQRLQLIWRNHQKLVLVVGGGGLTIYVLNLEQTPITGRWRFNIVSPELEKSAAGSSYQAVMDEYKNQLLPADHPYTQLCARVVERLLPTVAQFDKDTEWSVHVIDDPQTPNAFVTPGGNVFVFTGIFSMAQDENGLAAVLGHEIAHKIAHHVGEKLSGQIITMAGALLLSLVFDVSGQLGSQISTLILSLPNSRTQETEADHIGLLMMAEACYDPRRAPQIWERMVAEEQRRGGSVPQFMSTHPASAARAKTMQQWMPEAMDKYESGGCSITARGLDEFKKILNVGRPSRARSQGQRVTIPQQSRDDDDGWPF